MPLVTRMSKGRALTFQELDGNFLYLDAKLTPVTGSVDADAFADTNIIFGRLLSQTATGVTHYDATNINHRGTLAGIAMNSTVAGGPVRVRPTRSMIKLPGMGLLPGMLYMAGPDGQLVPSTYVLPLAFNQAMGRALSTEAILFAPTLPIKTTF